MSVDLTGTVAVVTGGANGIGLAAAAEFARAGADIVLGDLDDDALAEAADTIASAGRRVATVHCDVRSDSDHDDLLAAACNLGPIGVLMLNAGISSGGALEHVPISQWQDLFDINVIGVARGLLTFVPTLIGQDRASNIVITGSSASFSGCDNGVDAPYVASKHALLGIARSYRSYLARHDIGVQLLAPRMTDTAFPRSSIAWTNNGSFITTDRDIGAADTADDVARALTAHLGSDKLVIELDPETTHQIARLAASDIT